MNRYHEMHWAVKLAWKLQSITIAFLLLSTISFVATQTAHADLNSEVIIQLDPNNPDFRYSSQWKCCMVLRNIDLGNQTSVQIVSIRVMQNWTGQETVFFDSEDFENNLPLVVNDSMTSLWAYLFEWKGAIPQPGNYNVTVVLEWTEEWQVGQHAERAYQAELDVLEPSNVQTDYSYTAIFLALLFLSSIVLLLFIIRDGKRK